MNGKIRVLVVDDSKFMRSMITDILTSVEDITVIDTAKDGIEAVEKCLRLKPDVVTMDIEMPRMDGLTALIEIMEKSPVPVIIISAMDKRNADIAIKSIECGAFEFFPKPSGTVSLNMKLVRDELVMKVRSCAGANVERIKPVHITQSYRKQYILPGMEMSSRVVVIGASTGGPQAIEGILSKLPQSLPCAILIVQHMPEGFTSPFAERLNSISPMSVKQAENGETVRKGVAYIAPGGQHMTVQKDTGGSIKILLSGGEKVHNVRPSVDVLMESVSRIYAAKAVGVLLSGMGEDGVQGLKEIKKANGRTMAQSVETCVIPSMPKNAIDRGYVDKVVPLSQIHSEIVKILGVTG